MSTQGPKNYSHVHNHKSEQLKQHFESNSLILSISNASTSTSAFQKVDAIQEGLSNSPPQPQPQPLRYPDDMSIPEPRNGLKVPDGMLPENSDAPPSLPSPLSPWITYSPPGNHSHWKSVSPKRSQGNIPPGIIPMQGPYRQFNGSQAKITHGVPNSMVLKVFIPTPNPMEPMVNLSIPNSATTNIIRVAKITHGVPNSMVLKAFFPTPNTMALKLTFTIPNPMSVKARGTPVIRCRKMKP
ncbi:hypothetical protein BGZ76_001804, partial [Entomortierella beljakovae]